MKELIRHILKEETEDIDKNVMNFLMRRYKVEEINIDDQIRFKKVYFKVDDDYYNIGTFDNKKITHIGKKLLEQSKCFYLK